jgi:hypothetical protein
VILLELVRSGLWRAIDGEKVRFFFGFTPALHLSHRHPLWRRIPWLRALVSPVEARRVLVWLRYRIELFDGQAG